MEEPEPNTQRRICLNNYREGKQFEQRTVAEYFTEQGMKLTGDMISHTYKSRLKKMYQFIIKKQKEEME